MGLALFLAPLSRAAVIFQTGFEPSEGYALGQLAGQNGWFSSTAPTVESTVVFAGSQAVSWTATGVTLSEAHPLVYDSALDPYKTVLFDVKFMDSTAGAPSNWNVMSVTGDAGGIGLVFLSLAGDAKLFTTASGVVGSVPVSKGAWHDFQLFVDFNTQTISAYVDSQFIASGGFSSPSTKLADIVATTGTAPGSDTGFFDNLLVDLVPEPGTAGMLMTAGIALLVARFRRGIV
jgi:hypothetical protein